MSNPSVACVMLASGRPEMTTRAVRSFLSQAYDNRLLVIWDTGSEPLNIRAEKTVYCPVVGSGQRSIGELRNDAIGMATNADIVVTFDSDDWSGPRRIEEQVALLVASGAEACGYNEVLFWDTHKTDHVRDITTAIGLAGWEDRSESWLYSNPAPNYAIGASLAFWRSTWARRPFPHLPVPGNRQSAGEDAEWLKGVKCVGVSGIGDGQPYLTLRPGEPSLDAAMPRLICSVHGGNSQAYELALPSPYFKRVEQWDQYCRKEMAQ